MSSDSHRPAMIDPEAGKPWYHRSEEVRTRHRKVWAFVAVISFVHTFWFYGDIIDMLRPKGIHWKNCKSCKVVGDVCILLGPAYIVFFIIVAFKRLPGPYKLRRSEKQIFDSAFVVVCSCWTIWVRDQMNTTILGLLLCFHVIPMLNLWWDYENFGFCDCALTVLIEAALFCCRNDGVFLVAVAVVGVALQLMKSVYQEQRIKSAMEK